MPRRSPLIRIDPGWPWVAAGLLFLFAAVVVPAQRLLEQDRAELRRLQGVEARIYRLLEAHDRFLADLRAGEESLLLRLAAANLNRMPEGHEALILAGSIDRNPIEWIDSTVPAADPGPPPRSASLLERVLDGQGRLWVTAVGVLCLFTGLLLGPGWSSREETRGARPRRESTASPVAAVAAIDRDPEAEHARWRPIAAAAVSGIASGKSEDAAPPPDAAEVAWELEECGPAVALEVPGGVPVPAERASPEMAALASVAEAFTASREPIAADAGERIRVTAEELAMLLEAPQPPENGPDSGDA